MSAAKFASITSSLLARKGEAMPWQDPDKQDLLWRDLPRPRPEQIFPARAIEPPPRAPRLAERSPPPPPGPQKRCSVRMSPAEYEQLGIMAVKKGVTRQHLLQDALAQALAAMARDYGNCLCLGNCAGGGCSGRE